MNPSEFFATIFSIIIMLFFFGTYTYGSFYKTKCRKIKCNISSNGKKIYHLPSDRLYRRTKIDVTKGEMLCDTIEQAEQAGFVRSSIR